MPPFTSRELPLAFTLLETAARMKPRRDGSEHFHRYFLRWTAFQVMFSTIAAEKGLHSSLRLDENGTPFTLQNGGVHIPIVDVAGEREQLQLALTELDETFRHRLITHPAARFFLERTPTWQGKKIQKDKSGQALNGVIRLHHTVSEDHPVWSPLDRAVMDRYIAAPSAGADQDFLTGQLADILYSVRQNLMHGGRRLDDGNELGVFTHADQLLDVFLTAFTG